MEIQSHIQGIPCIIVARVCVNRGSYSRDAASDWDYYGYEEIDFEVLDRKGYNAPWLQRKLTSEDVTRIESEIAKCL
jgi:hypothetical protein